MWIKICGMRDVSTAESVGRLRPSAVGLNFYAPSPRAVDPSVVGEIIGRLPEEVEPVGLFVNESPDAIHQVCQRFGLRSVQLHGDEPIEVLGRLLDWNPGYRIIRAWRLGADGLGPLSEQLLQMKRAGIRPAACLVDAAVPGKFGGSGRTLPWETLAEQYNRHEWPPLILAGGLTPENVADAIRACRPWGVDVASGVESAEGEKDTGRVKEFLRAARAAFASLV